MERRETWARGVRPMACLLGLAMVAPAQAGAAIHVVETESIVLRVRPLTARMVGDVQDVTLELDPTTGGETELVLRWPQPQTQTPSRLRLRASLRMGFGRLVRLESELVEGDGRTTRATRDLPLPDGTAPSIIPFEVARAESGPLTLPSREK